MAGAEVGARIFHVREIGGVLLGRNYQAAKVGPARPVTILPNFTESFGSNPTTKSSSFRRYERRHRVDGPPV